MCIRWINVVVVDVLSLRNLLLVANETGNKHLYYGDLIRIEHSDYIFVCVCFGCCSGSSSSIKTTFANKETVNWICDHFNQIVYNFLSSFHCPIDAAITAAACRLLCLHVMTVQPERLQKLGGELSDKYFVNTRI